MKRPSSFLMPALLVMVAALTLASCKKGNGNEGPKTYDISVTAGTGGSAGATVDDVTVTKAAAGTTITLTATPDADYEFAGWTVAEGGDQDLLADASNAETTFNMPESAVSIEAAFSTHASIKISYYTEPENYADINGRFQNFNTGYGVVFDLTGFSDIQLHTVDFHHASWDVYGIWDYKIHVINITDEVFVYTTDVLQTTGDDKWETGIALENIEGLGGKEVGIFLEPLSGEDGDAYPTLSSDSTDTSLHSYKINLSTFEKMGNAELGEYIMNLWIIQ